MNPTPVAGDTPPSVDTRPLGWRNPTDEPVPPLALVLLLRTLRPLTRLLLLWRWIFDCCGCCSALALALALVLELELSRIFAPSNVVNG